MIGRYCCLVCRRWSGRHLLCRKHGHAFRHITTEPRDARFHYAERLKCRILRRHGRTCAGRHR